MKMNDEIRFQGAKDHKRIYDCDLVRGYTRDFIARRLSIMKQENIEEALKSRKYSLQCVKDALGERCGYCFQYGRCKECPLNKIAGKCYSHPRFVSMVSAGTKKEFLENHRLWRKCYKLYR